LPPDRQMATSPDDPIPHAFDPGGHTNLEFIKGRVLLDVLTDRRFLWVREFFSRCIFC
jgi:hypothetical protein